MKKKITFIVLALVLILAACATKTATPMTIERSYGTSDVANEQAVSGAPAPGLDAFSTSRLADFKKVRFNHLHLFFY